MKLEDLIVEEDHKLLPALLALLQRRKLKVFVGAGVTRAYGYPDWRILLGDLAQEKGEGKVPRAVLRLLQKSLNDADGGRSSACNFEEMAQKIENALGAAFLQQAVDVKFQPREIAERSSTATALDAIAGFDCGPFFTTNFDPMLERLLAKQHGVLEEEIALAGRYYQVLDALRNEDSRKVVKLHGTYNEWKDRVLTKAGYDKAYSPAEGTVAAVLRHLFCSHSVLFVGCSLGQDRTLTVLKEAHEFDPARWHYVLVREDSAMEDDLQRWRGLHIHPIRFRRAPDPDRFAYLPAVLQRLADRGRPIEVGAEPCLLAVIKTSPGGIRDGLVPKALIGSIEESDERINRDYWAPLSAGVLLNAGHTEEANDSLTTILARWRGRMPAPLPEVVAAAGCLLRHIREAAERLNSSELKVTFGFGNPIRLQGDRYLGPVVPSALHVLNRTRPLRADAVSLTPLVFDVSCVDCTAAVEQAQFSGLTVLDPIEGVFRTLDLSWAPGGKENGRSPSAMRLTVVCPHFEPRPSLLTLKYRFNPFSNQTLVLDLLEPLRKAKPPAFERARFEKLFGLLGDSIQAADLQLALEKDGKMSLHGRGGFMFKCGRAKRTQEVELTGNRKVHLFFDGDEWEITMECSQPGITVLRIISVRSSLPSLLHEWEIDVAEGEHNQILFQFSPTLPAEPTGDHEI